MVVWFDRGHLWLRCGLTVVFLWFVRVFLVVCPWFFCGFFFWFDRVFFFLWFVRVFCVLSVFFCGLVKPQSGPFGELNTLNTLQCTSLTRRVSSENSQWMMMMMMTLSLVVRAVDPLCHFHLSYSGVSGCTSTLVLSAQIGQRLHQAATTIQSIKYHLLPDTR